MRAELLGRTGPRRDRRDRRCHSKAPGCTLLDVDPGASTNRTVYTFVGWPDAVVEGALAGARVARQLIDMRTQSGEHPRVGALDVCPFVPVSGVTMQDCMALANAFGRRAADELGIPVFLYGHAARAEHRRTLQQIRAGEYEGSPSASRGPSGSPTTGLRRSCRTGEPPAPARATS